jgi:hypothetical protein
VGPIATAPSIAASAANDVVRINVDIAMLRFLVGTIGPGRQYRGVAQASHVAAAGPAGFVVGTERRSAVCAASSWAGRAVAGAAAAGHAVTADRGAGASGAPITTTRWPFAFPIVRPMAGTMLRAGFIRSLST